MATAGQRWRLVERIYGLGLRGVGGWWQRLQHSYIKPLSNHSFMLFALDSK